MTTTDSTNAEFDADSAPKQIQSTSISAPAEPSKEPRTLNSSVPPLPSAEIPESPPRPVANRRDRPLPELPRKQPRPEIGEYSLLVEGMVKITSDTGVVLNVPLNAVLPGTMSPGFIQMAQQQFSSVLDQLLIKPATIAFITHVESTLASRKADAEKAKRLSTTVPNTGHA